MYEVIFLSSVLKNLGYKNARSSYSNMVEVLLSYFLFYRADDPAMNWDYGGKTYICSKQSGNWVINSIKGWVR